MRTALLIPLFGVAAFSGVSALSAPNAPLPEPAARDLSALKRAYKKGDFDAAIAVGEKLTKAEPACSTCFDWLGRSYGQKARKSSLFTQLSLAKKCRFSFEKAVALDGKNLNARWALFQYYLNAPRIVGGGKDKAKALAGEVESIDAGEGHLMRGTVLESTDDLAAAEAELRAARAATPRDPKKLGALVGFLIRRQRVDEAWTEVKRAVEKAEGEPGFDFQLGRFAALTGRAAEEGIAALDRFLTHPELTDGDDVPSFSDAHWRKGQILATLGRKDEALAEYRAALDIEPGHQGARKSLDEAGR